MDTVQFAMRTPSKKEYLKSAFAKMFYSKKVKLFFIIMLCILLGSIIVHNYGPDEMHDISEIIGFVAFLIPLLVLAVLHSLGSKSYKDWINGVDAVNATIDSYGVKCECPGRWESSLGWPQIEKIYEMDKYLVVSYKWGTLTIYKNYLDEELLKEIKVVLKEAPVEKKQFL